jgi:ankyrin repeat protein
MLLAAVLLNQFDKADLLLKAGADFHAKDSAGHTIGDYIARFPFDKELDEGHWRDKVINFLRQHGVEVHPRNP